MPNTYKRSIGIDLGTTNLCCAIYDPESNISHIIANEDGDRTTPSYLSIIDNEKIIGKNAKMNYNLYPLNTIYDVKRLMGKMYNDESVQNDLEYMSYKIIHDQMGYILIEIEGKKYRPEEISAMYLQKMVQIAEDYLGNDENGKPIRIKDAVITVPAYFNDSQRTATKNAGLIIGLENINIINEPTAASLCYGLHKGNKNEKVLVFDLGGGTFDVSVLEIDDGLFKVLSTNGDTHLGGEDFDRLIVNYFIDKIIEKDINDKDIIDKDKDNGIEERINEIMNDHNVMSELKQKAEQVKKSLSGKMSEKVMFKIEFKSKIKIYNINMTRNIFENICSDIFLKCMDPVKIALEDAELNPSDIDEIILVGGSTRIPKICNMLKEFFNGKKLNQSINPDEAVAYGAAIQAHILSNKDNVEYNNNGNNDKSKDIVLLDVIPLSLGIRIKDGLISKIIPKNTNIPCSAKKLYSTIEDNQKSVKIDIYEGEREFDKDNHFLGSFILNDIQPALRGIPKIEVSFDVDTDGILTITAIDMKTLNKMLLTLNTESDLNNKLSKEEIDRMIKDGEKNRQHDALLKEIMEIKYNFHTYLDTSLRDLNNVEYADALTTDERSYINQIILANKDWLDSGDHTKDELLQCKDNVSEYINPLLNKVFSRKINAEIAEKNEMKDIEKNSEKLNSVLNDMLK
jgi:molecular chaperone DnaK (HSP70)